MFRPDPEASSQSMRVGPDLRNGLVLDQVRISRQEGQQQRQVGPLHQRAGQPSTRARHDPVRQSRKFCINAKTLRS